MASIIIKTKNWANKKESYETEQDLGRRRESHLETERVELC